MKGMDRQRVSSTDLSSVGYENGTLEIRFRSGGTYQYSGVPESVYHSLMNSSSKGRYFGRYIKGKYRYRKV
jgi:hypothetical protein